MSTNYHTAITYGAAASSAVINSPLSELDTQITANTSEITSARGSAASLDARLDVSLTAAGALATGAISAQSMVNLGAAASAAGDAVRYNEFTQEHNADGTHSTSAAIITAQAQVNLGAAASTNGDAIRYNEFVVQHNANGTHSTSAEIITAQAQVNLGSAAAANGDATRYNEFTQEHNADGTHKSTLALAKPFYVDYTASASTGTDAAALANYTKQSDNTNYMVCVRTAFYKASTIDTLYVRTYMVNTASLAEGTIKLACGGQENTRTVDANEGGDEYEVTLDISAVTDDTYCEVTVSMKYATTEAGPQTMGMSYVSLWA